MISTRTSQFFIYPRDCEGNLTKNVICVILREGKMYHGEATCSKKDNFSKKLGRELAFNRAIAAYAKRKGVV